MSVQLTQEMIDGAIATQQQYGVPASITLGQIMLESGGKYEGGLSTLAYKYNNLFGMTKGSSWSGETIYMTNSNGTDGQTYRVYSSVTESIIDHGKVLTNDRYTKYTSNASNYEEYAKGIQQGGYATDPNYANKLISVIKSNNLDRYDTVQVTGSIGTINVSKQSVDLTLIGHVVRIVFILIVFMTGVVFLALSFQDLGLDVSKVGKLLNKGGKKDDSE